MSAYRTMGTGSADIVAASVQGVPRVEAPLTTSSLISPRTLFDIDENSLNEGKGKTDTVF